MQRPLNKSMSGRCTASIARTTRALLAAMLRCYALLPLAGIALYSAASAAAAPAPGAPLRICADSNNLPFSNRRGEGFENQLATFIAARLGRPLQYVWIDRDVDLAALQLEHSACDAVIAEPSEATRVATTVPYYWSSYVLVSRSDRHLDLASLKDSRLSHMRIGVESIDREGFYTPPARLLIQQGLGSHLVPFVISASDSAHGARAPQDSRTELLQALVRGEIDVAAAWGPAVGYLARQSTVPLQVVVIKDGDGFSNRKEHFGLQAMQFQISMGVRRGDDRLRRALNSVIEAHRPEIQRMLEQFGVPLVSPPGGGQTLAHSDPDRAAAPAHRSGA